MERGRGKEGEERGGIEGEERGGKEGEEREEERGRGDGGEGGGGREGSTSCIEPNRTLSCEYSLCTSCLCPVGITLSIVYFGKYMQEF